MRGLLADNGGFRQQAGKALGQNRLAFVIGHGDDIVCRLVLDFVYAERLVARQYRPFGGLQHGRINRAGEGVVQLRLVRVDLDVAMRQIAGPDRRPALAEAEIESIRMSCP